MARRYTYRRMTPEQLSAAFDAINGLDPTAEKFTKGKFVRLSGWNHQKVDRMFSGETDIPHETTVLLAILADPKIGPRAMEIALTVTNAMIISEEE